MTKKKKIKINPDDNPTPGNGKGIYPGRKIPTFYITAFLIIILSVYTNPEQQRKEKSNFVKPSISTQTRTTPQYKPRTVPSARPSPSSPPLRIDNKNRYPARGNINANQGYKSKLGRKTGTITIKPRENFPRQGQNTKIRARRKSPKKTGRKRNPDCNQINAYDPYPSGGIIRYYDEEEVESPDGEYPVTYGGSNRSTAGRERQYDPDDSFATNPMLVERIREYNAKHLDKPGLEYPLTPRSVSLTYQLLDSAELIEHMEKNIEYYRQQLNAVRNSQKSPAEKEIWERFWLERINRLQDAVKKERARISDLRSEIAEEHKM